MRKGIREGLAAITSFDGITGSSKFDEQGDPIKCAVVVKISDKGEFVFEAVRLPVTNRLLIDKDRAGAKRPPLFC